MAFKVDPEAAKKVFDSLVSGTPPEEERNDPPLASPYMDDDCEVVTPSVSYKTDVPSAAVKEDPSVRSSAVDTLFGSGKRLTFTPVAPAPSSASRGAASKPYKSKAAYPPDSGGGMRTLDDDEAFLDEPREHVAPEHAFSAPRARTTGRRYTEGGVYDFRRIENEEVPTALSRWMTSLFSGVPFAFGRVGYSFLLKPDRYSDAGSRQVILYGTIIEGRPSNGSRVRVRGRTRGSGSLHAITIDLLTDPPTRVMLSRSMSAVTVWLATLLLVFFGAAILSALFRVGTNLYGVISTNLEQLIVYLLIIAACVWGLRRLFGRRRR